MQTQITPQNTASDQSLHCFQTKISSKNKFEMKKYTWDTPKIGNGLVQLGRMDESTIGVKKTLN